MTIPSEDGSCEIETPASLSNKPTLTEEQAVEIAKLGVKLEDAVGWHVDVECAYHGGRLYLLQCRPITTMETPSGGV